MIRQSKVSIGNANLQLMQMYAHGSTKNTQGIWEKQDWKVPVFSKWYQSKLMIGRRAKNISRIEGVHHCFCNTVLETLFAPWQSKSIFGMETFNLEWKLIIVSALRGLREYDASNRKQNLKGPVVSKCYQCRLESVVVPRMFRE